MAERRWFGRVWECERRVSKKHRRDIACEALGTARVWVLGALGRLTMSHFVPDARDREKDG